MGHGVFLRRVHFTEGLDFSIGNENWVKAKAKVAPHRPGQAAGADAFEQLFVTIRPGEPGCRCTIQRAECGSPFQYRDKEKRSLIGELFLHGRAEPSKFVPIFDSSIRR